MKYFRYFKLFFGVLLALTIPVGGSVVYAANGDFLEVDLLGDGLNPQDSVLNVRAVKKGDPLTIHAVIYEQGYSDVNIIWDWDGEMLKCSPYVDNSTYNHVEFQRLGCNVKAEGRSVVRATITGDNNGWIAKESNEIVVDTSQNKSSYLVDKSHSLRVAAYKGVFNYKGIPRGIKIDYCNDSSSRDFIPARENRLDFAIHINGEDKLWRIDQTVRAGECAEEVIPLGRNGLEFSNVLDDVNLANVGIRNSVTRAISKHSSKGLVFERAVVNAVPLVTPSHGGNAGLLPPGQIGDRVLPNIEQYYNPFPDIDPFFLEGRAVMELVRRGVVEGYPDGTFGGRITINRAEAAKFLMLASDFIGTSQDRSVFPDVPQFEWFTGYVMRAYYKGVLNGHPDGTFRPAETINRAEFLKMLSLAFNIGTGYRVNYADVPGNVWFAQYAGAASYFDLFPLDSDKNYLNPERKVTRAEMAIAIYQILATL